MPVLVLSLGKVELVVGDTDWDMGQNLRNTKKLAGYGHGSPVGQINSFGKFIFW